jgi:hypothetical protein
VFLNDTEEDRNGILPVLNQVVVYPLREFDGKLKTKHWKQVPSLPASGLHAENEIYWVNPATFFDQLPDILNHVPPLPGEEAIYAMFRTVLEAAEEDPQVMQSLKDAAASGEKDLVAPLIHWRLNGPPAGNGWHSPRDNGAFGFDYAVRTAVAKSNMYENRFNETKYIFTDTDSENQLLRGNNEYAITFPAGQLPPVHGFWSLTLYNEHHFFAPNELKRYSLGTKNKTLQYNPDGSLTLYVQAEPPAEEKRSNWLPAPESDFSLYLRAYWPQAAITNGTWTPPAVVRLE